MIRLRLSILAVLVSAGLAGYFSLFITPLLRITVDRQLPTAAPDLKGPGPAAPTNVDHPGPSAEEQAAAAFLRAAQAILKKPPDAEAFASIDEPPINGRIPLPKRRPLPH
jgi:hypothetical protein